jgi:hypothetical protein
MTWSIVGESLDCLDGGLRREVGVFDSALGVTDQVDQGADARPKHLEQPMEQSIAGCCAQHRHLVPMTVNRGRVLVACHVASPA